MVKKGVTKGGRKAGVPNNIPPDIKHLARKYAVESIETVYRVMKRSKFEQNRVAAAQILMDRGFGKPTQAIAGDPEMPVQITVKWQD